MASVMQAAVHDARLSMLAARCGAMVSGIAGISSRGISGRAVWTRPRRPDKAERRMTEPIGAQPTGPLRGLRVFD